MKDEVKKPGTSFIPLRPSLLIPKIMRALRGEVSARTVALEAWRRSGVSLVRRKERAMLDRLDAEPAHLTREHAKLSPADLLAHFRHRSSPKFFAGFDAPAEDIAEMQKSLFPSETAHLIEMAARISQQHRWPLMGYAERDFGTEIQWRADLLSSEEWSADYHAEIDLARSGSDVRIVWELNRLAHLITLGRAYTITQDEELAEEFFAQVESWRADNPVGRGPNWACAMEVALRAMNLLAAFQLFRRSPKMDEQRLLRLLALFEQHGAHIRRNLEFSYIATSNHYLSDIVGLLWLGVMLPELEAAREWRESGLREMLREMKVQVFDDGADFEASTGYHRLVLELFLYSFLLCRANRIEIPEEYWHKLRKMFAYLCAYLRPDGRAPLIGDTDSGQVLPVVKRMADDHAPLLALGAAVFEEPRFKLTTNEAMPEEMLWILGQEGVSTYQGLTARGTGQASQGFKDAGTYIMREGDLYMLFNASGCGVGGRGSHGHNDSLSIEVSACGTSFITDPGTYVYRTDLYERHLFRSTAYHSTVEVDGIEQNTIIESLPFIIGDEARPRLLEWETGEERDHVVAGHAGYARLAQPVSHSRSIEFDKRGRCWLIEDSLTGTGEHLFRFRFHLAPGLSTSLSADGNLAACDKITGAQLFIIPLGESVVPEMEPRWTSRDYGAKMPSVSACWALRANVPLTRRWLLVPVCAGEDESERVRVSISNFKSQI